MIHVLIELPIGKVDIELDLADVAGLLAEPLIRGLIPPQYLAIADIIVKLLGDHNG